jgi:hypothetical protein
MKYAGVTIDFQVIDFRNQVMWGRPSSLPEHFGRQAGKPAPQIMKLFF